MTIEKVKLKKVKDIMRVVIDQSENANGRYREHYLYRGLPNIDFKLVTSLQRNCKSKCGTLEKPILDNFAKYIATEKPIAPNDVWRNMILGQHHGLPTRLLDWTHSPFVALHFAVSDSAQDDFAEHDSVLWRVDYKEVHTLLPDVFKAKMKEADTSMFSVDMLHDVAPGIKEYDDLLENKSMVFMEPPSIDPRIVNQYAFFSVIPRQMVDIEQFFKACPVKVYKYVISKDIKWKIRDFLDEANLSERMIYPGLDGICKWLARHYQVKE